MAESTLDPLRLSEKGACAVAYFDIYTVYEVYLVYVGRYVDNASVIVPQNMVTFLTYLFATPATLSKACRGGKPPSYSRQPTTNTKHAEDNSQAVSAYSAWQKMFVLGETPKFWENRRCGMRHGAHIALIPNQLSPVHRDMQIYMSFKLGGLLIP